MSNPEDAALLKEADDWRNTHDHDFQSPGEALVWPLVMALRAALAREAEMQQEHNRAYAELLGHSVEQEQRAKAAERERDTIAAHGKPALQVDLKRE